MKILTFLSLLVFSVSAAAKSNERLVVAGGSLTEIVYALGAQDALVGVDSSSHYPREASELPDVGYFRTLNVEGILSVSPSKLLLLQGSGPQKVLDQIDALGIETVIVDNPKTIAGLKSVIRKVADSTGTSDKGEQLIAQIDQHLQKVKSASPLVEKSAVFLMSAGERGLVAAGENTTPQLIFNELNIANPFSSLDGFKPVSAEALAQSQPDVILIASHTTRGLSVDSLCESNQLRLWAAQNGCNLVKIDSLKYLGLTPRLPEAIAETHGLYQAL